MNFMFLRPCLQDSRVFKQSGTHTRQPRQPRQSRRRHANARQSDLHANAQPPTRQWSKQYQFEFLNETSESQE